MSSVDLISKSSQILLSYIQPASATAIPTSAASAWRSSSSRADAVEECVKSADTTRPDVTASTVRMDTPATTANL